MHVLAEDNLFREPLELLCMAVGWDVEHYSLGRYGVLHFESTTVYGNGWGTYIKMSCWKAYI